MNADARVSAVIVTRNRVQELLACVERLRRTEVAHIVVVDNGSDDGSPYRVRARHPDVEVVTLSENRGAAARNIGVALCEAPYVAFVDDDSAWDPGSLSAAADIMDAHPSVAVVCARIVLPDGRADPICSLMEQSPLRAHAAGRRVLGFVACASVVRRDAFLAAGGFHPRMAVGGEEELLAQDLAAGGWDLVYAAELRARHWPSPQRDIAARRRRVLRNRLLAQWLRRPLGPALAASVRLVCNAAVRHPPALSGAVAALTDITWVRRSRAPVGGALEAELRRLEAAEPDSGAVLISDSAVAT